MHLFYPLDRLRVAEAFSEKQLVKSRLWLKILWCSPMESPSKELDNT